MSMTIRAENKPTLLFVGHAFHTRTRSSQFMIEVLERHFRVDCLFIDPSAKMNHEQWPDTEFVYVWQLDYLAPVFIALGRRVIISPMYDGSYPTDDLHWRACRQALFVNFSLGMHLRAVTNGCHSVLTKYFPDPKNYKKVEDFDTLGVFLWERLPRSFLNRDYVHHLFNSVDRVHIHAAPDNPLHRSQLSAEPYEPDYTVSTSSWFERRSDLDAVIDALNIYVAPRPAEGIGMGFLEAMARGMIVVANDRPTHSEYIDNWVDGILVNEKTTGIDLRRPETLRSISVNARTKVEAGHKAWKEGLRDLVEQIRQTPRPIVSKEPFFLSQALSLAESHAGRVHQYNASLAMNRLLVEMLASWGGDDAGSGNGKSAEVVGGDIKIPSNASVIAFGAGNARDFMISGWSQSQSGALGLNEPAHTWAIEQSAVLRVPLHSSQKLRGIKFVARGLQDSELDVVVNGDALTSIELEKKFKIFNLDFGLDKNLFVEPFIELKFKLRDDVPAPVNDRRALKFAISKIVLYWGEAS